MKIEPESIPGLEAENMMHVSPPDMGVSPPDMDVSHTAIRWYSCDMAVSPPDMQ